MPVNLCSVDSITMLRSFKSVCVHTKLVPTDDNAADLFTKMLERVKFAKFSAEVMNYSLPVAASTGGIGV